MSTHADSATGAVQAGGPERRREGRQRALKGAVLSFNKGFSAFECVVRNISAGGARLSLAETFALPSAFTLSMNGAAARQAVVRWRSENTVGVAFVEPDKAAPAA